MKHEVDTVGREVSFIYCVYYTILKKIKVEERRGGEKRRGSVRKEE